MESGKKGLPAVKSRWRSPCCCFANSKMHDKNDEIKTVKAKYEKEAKSLKKQLKEAKNEQKEVNLQSNEWNLLLVNSSYPLAADYSPELTAVDDEDHKVDSRKEPPPEEEELGR